MNRAILVTIIVIVILLALGVALFSLGYIQKENLPEAVQNFFPEGEDIGRPAGGGSTGGTNQNGGSQNGTPSNGSGGEAGTSRFTQIFPGAVSGYAVFEKGGDTRILFIEKETGHVYEYSDAEKSYTKISNLTMPGIEEVLWNEEGSSFIVRYYNQDTGLITTKLLSFDQTDNEEGLYTFTEARSLGDRADDIFYLQKTLNENPGTQIAQTGAGSPGQETKYFGTKTQDALKIFQAQFELDETGQLDNQTLTHINETNRLLFGEDDDITETRLTEKDLGNIEAIVSHKNRVFYTQQVGEITRGYVSDFTLSNPLRIFESPFSSWEVSWPHKDAIILQTKSSGRAQGHLFSLNPTTGRLTKKLGSIYGLTSLADNRGSVVLYSQTTKQGKNMSAFLFDSTTRETKNLQSQTVADKCAWGNERTELLFCAVPDTLGNETLPDEWYQGKVSFTDQFWMINTETTEDTLLFENERRSFGVEIDAINVSLNEDEDTLFMLNKKDLSLWNLSLGQ